MSVTKQRIIEVFPGFFYAQASEIGRIRFVFYRINQLLQILFSGKFRSSDAILKSTLKRYEMTDQLDFYERLATHGLLSFEILALHEILNQSNPPSSALVVGCGAGREAFALEKAGLKTTGVDNSGQFIQRALRIKNDHSSSAEFFSGELNTFVPKDAQFDLVWITYGLLNHIAGAKNRLAFLDSMKQRLGERGSIFVASDILSPKDTNRKLKLSSIFLKLIWLGKKMWQPGDILRSNLGPFSISPYLIYYHYYPDHFSAEAEFETAGLKWVNHGEFWILKK